MSIHRKHRLPCAALGSALLALLLATSGPAAADDDDDNVTVVYPTGDPAQDVGNIQDAVAEGGVVLLKATDRDGNPTAFNFGQNFPETLLEAFDAREENSVNIRRSVRIRGESLDDDWAENDDDDDGDLDDEFSTTIEGGFEPFHLVAPDIDVVIEGIHFTCTRYKVISVKAGERVVIRNNRFRKVTFFQDDRRTFGIGVANDTGRPTVSVGTVEVTGNLIDPNPDPSPACPLPADDPDPSREELGTKITFGFLGANVEGHLIITDNLVRNTARLGIGFLDADGAIEVRGNVIEPGPLATAQPCCNLGIGAQIGLIDAQRPGGRFRITDNAITCTHPNCRGMVIGDISLPRQAQAVVKNNHIDMAISEPDAPDLPEAAGIELFMSNSVVARNKIEGRSNFAVLLEGDFGGDLFGLADNNRVARNNVRNFTPLSTNYFGLSLPEPVHYALFDANDNRLRGRSGKVCLGGFTGSSGNVVKGGLEVVVGENCQ